MIDLTRLNNLGGGVPKSKAIRPGMNIEEQLELMDQYNKFLKEQRDRIVKTSTLKLNIYRAFAEDAPLSELLQLLLECVSVATNDKAFVEMCQKHRGEESN